MKLMTKPASRIVLEGDIQMDETFFNYCEKGNKNPGKMGKNKKFMKKEPVVKKRGISNQKVCVCSAIDSSRNTISKATNFGHVTIKDLNSHFEKRLVKGSILITDGLNSYIGFAKENDFDHIRLVAGRSTDKKYNLAKINNYHSSIKSAFERFKGVSTKYLNEYLALVDLVDFNNNDFDYKKLKLKRLLISEETTFRAKDIPKAKFLGKNEGGNSFV